MDQSEAKLRNKLPIVYYLVRVDPLEVAVISAALSVRAEATIPE